MEDQTTPGANNTSSAAQRVTGEADPSVEDKDQSADQTRASRGDPSEGRFAPGDAHRSSHNFFQHSTFTGQVNFDSQSVRRAWPTALIEVKTLAQLKGPQPPHSELDAWLTRLESKRLLVVVHSPARAPQGKAAWLSLLHELKRRRPELRCYSTDHDPELKLRDLAVMPEWSGKFNHSMVYLDLWSDHNASLFFTRDQISASRLGDALRDSHSYLVVTIAADHLLTQIASSRALDGIAYWPFHDADAAGSDGTLPQHAEMLDSVILSCVGLFPGLQPPELVALVNQLWPEAAKSPPPTDTAKARRGAAYSVAELRIQRWRRSEVDPVLTELGVRYASDPDDDGPGGAVRHGGFYIGDVRFRNVAARWAINSLPTLLVGSIRELTRRFLLNTASHQYRNGYLRLLTQLDSMSAHRVDAAWFLKELRDLVETDPTSIDSEAVAQLMETVASLRADEGTVRAIADGLATYICTQEDAFSAILELKWVAQASVAAAHSKLQDRASSFWKSLWDSPSLNSALILLSQRQSIALRALLDMRAKSATPVVAALGRVLGTDGTTAALNRRLPDALASLERFAMLVLFGLLIDRIWESPARWLARVTELTSASMDAMPAVGVSNRSRNRDATPLELTAKRLAELNTEALAAVLDENSSTEVIDSVCQRLFSSELSARSGAELGSALVSACRDDVASNKLATVALYPTTRGALVDMLYHMTQALLRMPMANPVCVARLMLDITAAVRTKLGSVLRRQYLEHARAWLEYMHAQRDRQADRAAGAEMRKSIQALQIVLRSLRGIEPVGAVQP